MRSEEFALKLKNLPDSPGCYLMKSQGRIIYVGKAVNLKNRVRQYFQSSKNHTPKVQAMVEHVDDFDIVLVDSEMEALALELNLIKRYRPKYNILLKDDKHFPYIRVDLAQDYPRLELVRKQARDGARYFGPYKARDRRARGAGRGAHGLSHSHLQPRHSPGKAPAPLRPPRDRPVPRPPARA